MEEMMKALDEMQNQYKGKKNPNQLSRKELLNMARQQREAAKGQGQYKILATPTSKSTPAKRAVTVDSSKLKPILINDLLVETVHTGRVLIVRTITDAFKMNAIQFIVEDQNGGDEAIPVSLYNYILPGKKSADAEVNALFPTGVILAIKEPYFKISISGTLAVRIEDPQDLEIIDTPDHPLLTNKAWKDKLISKLPKDVEGWRLCGNDYYKAENYERAMWAYNNGLKIEPGHPILTLNKLASLLLLKRYYDLIPIALEIMPKMSTNEKLFIRLSKSYYALGLYEKAMEYFQKMLDFSPKNSKDSTVLALQQEGKNGIQNCKERIKERDTGEYNFNTVKETFETTKQVDCSEYIGPVKIIENKRGLAVTRDVPAGTLLAVSKGVGVFHESGVPVEYGLEVDLGDMTAYDHNSVQVMKLTKRDVEINPMTALPLSKLYLGNRATNSESYQSEKVELNDFRTTEENFNKKPVQLSMDQVKALVKYHAFQNETTKAHGIWALPSLINHACLSNAARFCIGDVMFIHAAKNLKEGEEIFMAYVPFEMAYEDRKKALDKFEAGECTCHLCGLDRQETKQSQKERERLTNYFQDSITPKIKDFKNLNVAVIPMVEKCIKDIKNTYNPSRSGLQMEAFYPMTALGLLNQLVSPDKAVKTYIECLVITGFYGKLDFSKTSTSSSTKPIHFKIQYDGTLQPQHTDLFMHICNEAITLGYETLARQTLALSRLSALIHSCQSTSEHTKHYKSRGFGKSNKSLFDYQDTVQFI